MIFDGEQRPDTEKFAHPSPVDSILKNLDLRIFLVAPLLDESKKQSITSDSTGLIWIQNLQGMLLWIVLTFPTFQIVFHM